MDEEKEPHFVLGKSRVNAMDYAGAVEAFTESLEVNPRSAAAHFQLACLFDTKESDPAAAVYHYQEFLRLNPKADNAEVIRQRIYSCKQQLAADVLPLPSAPAATKQLEELAEKNHKLQDEVEKWRAYYTAQQNAPKTAPDAGGNPAAGSSIPDDISTPASAAKPGTTTSARTMITPLPDPKPAAKPRTYKVAAGETLASIARKSGVSLTAMRAANPGVTPSKMRVGQVLNLPSP
jgi:LysM repeat protein